MAAVSTEWADLVEISQNMVSGFLDVVNQQIFSEALQKVRNGMEAPTAQLMRALGIELWLRRLSNQGMLKGSRSNIVRNPSLRHEPSVLTEPRL